MPHAYTEDQLVEQPAIWLAGKHGEYDIVLANPPFGKKSSGTIVNEAREQSKESLIINRDELKKQAFATSWAIGQAL